MKSDLGISHEIEDYVSRFGVREHPALKRCREETHANLPQAQMQIGEDQGAFMALLVKLIGAKRYLEVGTFTGYSALAVALALPADGKAVCLDISKEYTDLARGYWKEAGVDSKIDLRLGPALDSIDTIIAANDAPFDFVFIDADKPNYDGYYERALKLVRKGGLIAVDNMLWSGAVADPSNKEASTRVIGALNEKIHADPRVDMALATIADGIMLACKR
ncbi:MAG TPA: class I SAM-dependent methyltransferase [Rhizomicrobium sp.]|nr:class I SAM-dependent methyltransferase [Rhizomicrobium sp.]